MCIRTLITLKNFPEQLPCFFFFFLIFLNDTENILDRLEHWGTKGGMEKSGSGIRPRTFL